MAGEKLQREDQAAQQNIRGAPARSRYAGRDIAEVDVLASLAHVAALRNYCRPQFITPAAGETQSDAGELEIVSAVAGELDNAGFDAQDRLEDGSATDADYVRAFTRACAAAALLAALEDDAENAIYEAYHAVDEDVGILRCAIDAA